MKQYLKIYMKSGKVFDLVGYAACGAEVNLEIHTVDVLSSFPTSEV